MAPIKMSDWLDIVATRAVGFLEDEIGLAVSRKNLDVMDAQKITLQYLTSLMSLEGKVRMYLGFTFEERLIRHINDVFTEDIDVEPDEIDIYLQESAGEMINIIIGNATADLEPSGPAINLSPPVVITQANKMLRHRDAKFYAIELDTPQGELSVFCVAPKELFDDHLNVIGG
jgi:CheY-specific phosphatase CheX